MRCLCTKEYFSEGFCYNLNTGVALMTQKRLLHIQQQIARIKQELLQIGEMRPGSLTRQYKNPKEKTGGFYQISYTHKNKSKTEYVKAYHVDALKQQITVYKKFKKLVEQWIDLAIKYSKLKLEIDNQNKVK
jgi:hypothetical protein